MLIKIKNTKVFYMVNTSTPLSVTTLILSEQY